MHAILLCAVIATVSGATIATPNNTSNLTKREVLEFYPDWVPFKNKHGNELGDFVDVTKPKAKVKKRLALPMNFLMKSVSDDADDYPGQGESDSEDYFDKKDWSDLNRPVLNKTLPDNSDSNISDIDGVLNIITQKAPSLADEINKSIPKSIDDYEDETKKDLKVIGKTEVHSTTTPEPRELEIPKKIEKSIKVEDAPKPKVSIFSDYNDESVSSSTEKPEIPEKEEKDNEEKENEQKDSEEKDNEEKDNEAKENETKENEEKKKIILDSVDQLKLRHEAEQRAISEKTKEEEFDNEFRHKSIQSKKNRLNSKRQRAKPTPPDYDEYEDLSWKDKYKINVEKATEKPQPISISTSRKPIQTTRRKQSSSEKQAPKYSVFRNPDLYMIDEENLSEKNENEHRTPKPPRRFSAKYSSTKPNLIDSTDNNVSQASHTVQTAEPILYFPKVKSRRKNKKPRRFSTTTAAPDSSVAETVEDKLKHTTIPITYADTTAPATGEDYKTTAIDSESPTTTEGLWKAEKPKDKETTAPDTEGTTAPSEDLTTAQFTSPSGYSAEAESSNTETVTDAVPAPSHHAKKETHEEPKDYHVEKGGGSEHHSSHEEEHAEHGKKAYEGLHRNTKHKKGHHDKEDHHGRYDDHGLLDKSHHNEAGHYGAHHHEEHGKKQAKYEESGKHSKGHSTKGSHDIHKKEEYEKNVEFFEEEGDSAEEEKHGGYHNEKEHKSGGHIKKGNLDAAHHEKMKEDTGHFAKGGHHDVHKGHKSSFAHDGHGKKGAGHHMAEGQRGGKKWVYHHGSPAKNANLIVIDRRTDRYTHGPSYYG